jgi:hypothetical protein
MADACGETRATVSSGVLVRCVPRRKAFGALPSRLRARSSTVGSMRRNSDRAGECRGHPVQAAPPFFFFFGFLGDGFVPETPEPPFATTNEPAGSVTAPAAAPASPSSFRR